MKLYVVAAEQMHDYPGQTVLREMISCSDCCYYREPVAPEYSDISWCKVHRKFVFGNDYCAWSKRKENE